MRTLELVSRAFGCDTHRARYHLARLQEVGLKVVPDDKHKVLGDLLLNPRHDSDKERVSTCGDAWLP